MLSLQGNKCMGTEAMKGFLAFSAVSLMTILPAAAQMTADEIKSDLIGKVLCITLKNGNEACVRHKADGTSEVISGLEKQNGAWRLDGDKHCAKWAKIRDGKELCSTYEKTGTGFSSPNFGKVSVK